MLLSLCALLSLGQFFQGFVKVRAVDAGNVNVPAQAIEKMASFLKSQLNEVPKDPQYFFAYRKDTDSYWLFFAPTQLQVTYSGFVGDTGNVDVRSAEDYYIIELDKNWNIKVNVTRQKGYAPLKIGSTKDVTPIYGKANFVGYNYNKPFNALIDKLNDGSLSGKDRNFFTSLFAILLAPLEAIRDGVSALGNVFTSAISGLSSAIGGFFSSLGSLISNAFSSLTLSIKGFFDGLFAFINDLLFPKQRELLEIMNNFKKFAESKLGFLSQSFLFVGDLIASLSTDEVKYVYDLPSMSLLGFEIVNMKYDLSFIEQFGFIRLLILNAIRMGLTFSFISFLMKERETFTNVD